MSPEPTTLACCTPLGDGARWEWYVKTGDSDQLTNEIVSGGDTEAMCCAPVVSEPVTLGRVAETAPASSGGGCC